MMETEYDMLYLASCALNGGSIDIERIKILICNSF